MTRHLEHHHGIINFNYACNFLKEDVFLTLEPPGFFQNRRDLWNIIRVSWVLVCKTSFSKKVYFQYLDKFQFATKLSRGRCIFKTWATRINFKSNGTFGTSSGHHKFQLCILLPRGRFIINTWSNGINFKSDETFGTSSGCHEF